MNANSAIVAAYDADEAKRMRNSYEAKRKKKQVKGFIQPTTQFETLTIGARFVKVQAGFNISESK